MKFTRESFKPNNIFAGLIVAVVALPLCIAFAIASGAHPVAGIISGVLGGLIAALFGSSRFQVSGPAAAFITIIYGIIATHGMSVLFAATFLAGAIVLLIALFRLGKMMELMPHSVIVGFTTGIGLLILLSQVPVALGVDAKGGDAMEKLVYTFSHLEEARLPELALLALTLAIAGAYGRTRFVRWFPVPLMALLVGAGAAFLLESSGTPIRTIGEQYTVSLDSLTASADFLRHFGALSDTQLMEVAAAGVTLGLLIAVETLLSSRALDAMTRSTHNPDRELIGHGLANLAVPFLGGLPVSGVIVRGSTNVMAGATEKSASILHAVFLAIFVAILFPLVGMLPLVALAAVLMLTAKRLIEIEEIRRIFFIAPAEGFLVVVTMLLTVTIDLTVSVPIGVGFMLLMAIRRIINERHVDVIDRGDHVAILVENSMTFLTGPALRDEIARHLANNPRIQEIDFGKCATIDASGAIMLARLLQAYPDLRLTVTSSKRMDQLCHAGIPAKKISMQGNLIVDMPAVYKGIRHYAVQGPSLTQALKTK
jgi:SulP family sulfate permease